MKSRLFHKSYSLKEPKNSFYETFLILFRLVFSLLWLNLSTFAFSFGNILFELRN